LEEAIGLKTVFAAAEIIHVRDLPACGNIFAS